MALGMVAGVGGSYLAAKAYRKAKAKCPPFSKRVYRSSDELVEAFGEFWRAPGVLRSIRDNSRIDLALAEKIMLAVTGVNGGRHCSYVHARHAMRVGISREEVEALLRGEFEYATVDQAPALFFAQHYAERRGHPDPDLVQRLVDTWGESGARDLVAYIRLVTMGNLVGNTVDALASRVLGQPSPDTTLRDELSVLAVFVFGVLPVMPLLMLCAALAPLPSE